MRNNYIFESERLGFRMWKDSDRKLFARMNKDLEVMEFFPKSLNEEESNAFVDRIQDHMEKDGYGLWAVEIKETGDFIGFIGFAKPSFESFFTPCIEIGWRLDKEFWNRGYGTEGARRCLEYGFDKLGFTEIHSFTSKINVRSWHLMEKIGMVKLGDFDHPRIEEGNPLKPHVVYLIKK